MVHGKGGIIINNNGNYEIIKARVSSELAITLKTILSKLNMTQQDLIENFIKNFIIDNLNLVIVTDTQNEK